MTRIRTTMPSKPESPSTRHFQTDFCLPALRGLDLESAARVALALDIAIAFGALEYAEGNPSLQDLPMLRALYAGKVDRLRRDDLRPRTAQEDIDAIQEA